MKPTVAPLDESSFDAVLAGAQAGESWAAERLFVDLQPRVLRFLRSTEPKSADDIASEVWLAVASGIRSFVGDLPSFRAWVFTIARHRLSDLRRTAARRATEPVGSEFFDQATESDGPEAMVLADLSAQQAVDLIKAMLPEDQAEVLLLRIIAELDVAHVAEVMDRTANWVRVTQHRALRRLAQALTENVARPVIPTTPGTI